MKQKNTKLEAPEGGWGLLVCLGMALPFASALSMPPSFGLLFGDFMKSIGAETGALSLVTSIFYSTHSLSALLSGSLFKRFGLRRTALVAAFVFFLGSICLIFVQSTFHLIISHGVLQGTSFGIIIPAAYTTFNNYFVKKRVFWMSIAQSLIGVGIMMFPIAVEMLMEIYGMRGCVAIIAAFNAHAIWGMLVMHPVEWHLKEVPINDHEMLERTNVKNINEIEKDESTKQTLLKAKPIKTLPLQVEELRSRSSSIVSIGNWTGPVILSDVSPQMSNSNTRRQSRLASVQSEKKSTGIWQSVVDFLDLKLVKDPIYMNMVVGLAFALGSDITAFSMHPLYLFELGFSKHETATLIAIGAASDLFSRIMLAFSAAFVQISPRNIYLAGCFFTLIARFAFLEVFQFTAMACMIAVLGFLRTWLHVPIPLVFAEYLPTDRFGTGYGLFMFVSGHIIFFVGPLIGYFRDSTRNYNLTFHILNALMAVLVIAWSVEKVYIRFSKKKISPTA